MDKTDLQSDIGIKEKFEEPVDYNVILLNDDFTTMEFVVYILKIIFHKSDSEAYNIMMSVHKNGSGLAGTYSYDIAITKRNEVLKLAQANKFPLVCLVKEAR